MQGGDRSGARRRRPPPPEEEERPGAGPTAASRADGRVRARSNSVLKDSADAREGIYKGLAPCSFRGIYKGPLPLVRTTAPWVVRSRDLTKFHAMAILDGPL